MTTLNRIGISKRPLSWRQISTGTRFLGGWRGMDGWARAVEGEARKGERPEVII